MYESRVKILKTPVSFQDILCQICAAAEIKETAIVNIVHCFSTNNFYVLVLFVCENILKEAVNPYLFLPIYLTLKVLNF